MDAIPVGGTVEYWASVITAEWRETVDGIMAVSRRLHEAHEELKTTPKAWARLTGRGKFPKLLPFRWRCAERLKCIGEDKRLVSYTAQLPPDWMTIYLLTTLSNADLERFNAEGRINSEMNQAKIRAFKRLLRREKEAAEIEHIVAAYCIHHCAIEDVDATLLPDASVHAVITDPPYPPEFLPAFSHLAEFAERVLMPGGWCIVMTGAVYLPEVIGRLAAKLTYRWQYVVITPGGGHPRMVELPSFQAYKPVLLFQKLPRSRIREWWPDVITARAREQDKSLHRWQQSEEVFATLVERFSLPGNLVVDPFAGSGTTGRAAVSLGRHFWGCDSDPVCATVQFQQAAE